jgi:hypothetical protein
MELRQHVCEHGNTVDADNPVEQRLAVQLFGFQDVHVSDRKIYTGMRVKLCRAGGLRLGTP